MQLDSHKNEQGDCLLEDGCIDEQGHVAGTYLHGIFDSDAVIRLLGQWLGVNLNTSDDYQQQQEQAIDKLADVMTEHLDLAKIFSYLDIRT